MTELSNIELNVKDLLRDDINKNATNKEFTMKYWRTYDGLKTRINLPMFRRLTDTESILRCKRKVVERNPSLAPTDINVITEKRKKERRMRRLALS